SAGIGESGEAFGVFSTPTPNTLDRIDAAWPTPLRFIVVANRQKDVQRAIPMMGRLFTRCRTIRSLGSSLGRTGSRGEEITAQPKVQVSASNDTASRHDEARQQHRKY